MRRWACILTMLVALAGCGGGGSREADTSSPPPEFQVAEGAGIFSLAGVDRYRERVAFTVSGPGAEEGALTGTFAIEAEYVRDPSAEHLVLSGPEPDSEEKLEFVRVGDRQWVKAGTGGWREVPPGDPTPDSTEALPITPQDLERIREYLEFVGYEELNGRRTLHFLGDVEAVRRLLAASEAAGAGASEVNDARVDAWVDPAGFVVLMEVEMTGPGLGVEGTDLETTLALSYEVYDLGAPIAIEPPAEDSG